MFVISQGNTNSSIDCQTEVSLIRYISLNPPRQHTPNTIYLMGRVGGAGYVFVDTQYNIQDVLVSRISYISVLLLDRVSIINGNFFVFRLHN